MRFYSDENKKSEPLFVRFVTVDTVQLDNNELATASSGLVVSRVMKEEAWLLAWLAAHPEQKAGSLD